MVSAEVCYEIPIILPDLSTQQKIVTYLNHLSAQQQSIQQQYTKKLQRLKALKASLLHAAFRERKPVWLMSLSKVAEEEGKYGK